MIRVFLTSMMRSNIKVQVCIENNTVQHHHVMHMTSVIAKLTAQFYLDTIILFQILLVGNPFGDTLAFMTQMDM